MHTVSAPSPSPAVKVKVMVKAKAWQRWCGGSEEIGNKVCTQYMEIPTREKQAQGGINFWLAAYCLAVCVLHVLPAGLGKEEWCVHPGQAQTWPLS